VEVKDKVISTLLSTLLSFYGWVSIYYVQLFFFPPLSIFWQNLKNLVLRAVQKEWGFEFRIYHTQHVCMFIFVRSHIVHEPYICIYITNIGCVFHLRLNYLHFAARGRDYNMDITNSQAITAVVPAPISRTSSLSTIILPTSQREGKW
jgi:hypothetical protein